MGGECLVLLVVQFEAAMGRSFEVLCRHWVKALVEKKPQMFCVKSFSSLCGVN